ncbi:MAG: SGNH/GDSL hydrolase family protein [Muribaculaceae bacterium]|nr:SGNH/GDSL hydrolase family protein [Muribaculaceae bacterium]
MKITVILNFILFSIPAIIPAEAMNSGRQESLSSGNSKAIQADADASSNADEEKGIENEKDYSGNEWRGKRVAILGDSMSDPEMKRVSQKRFYDYLQESIGIEPLPYAHSGYTWKELAGMAQRLTEEHPDDLDAIFIWAGTNDYNKSLPLGDFFTKTKSKVNANGEEVWRDHKHYNRDENTFTGRINNVLGYLKRHYPETQIVVLTPIHRGYAKFRENNIQPSEEYSNALGLFIDDYVETIKEGAKIWSVPVIDLFSESGIVPALPNQSIYIANPETDRLHPNDKGQKRIAKVVEYKLRGIPPSFKDE